PAAAAGPGRPSTTVRPDSSSTPATPGPSPRPSPGCSPTRPSARPWAPPPGPGPPPPSPTTRWPPAAAPWPGATLPCSPRAALRTARQEDRITVGGLFFLQGSAPRPVRRLLLGSLLAALAVTVVTASGEPFGVLQPVFPLSLCAQWGARHGTFGRIADPHPD